MTGFEYFRKKARLTAKKLAQLCGETEAQIYHMNCGPALETRCRSLVKISEALDMPIDVLLWEFDDSELASGDRGVFLSEKTIESNPLEIYRRINNLSYEQMAEMLRMSRQNVHRLGKNSYAREGHLEKLAAHEGITYSKFLKKYKIPDRAILPDRGEGRTCS